MIRSFSLQSNSNEQCELEWFLLEILKQGKRPDMFVELAKRHPEADFVWYGGHGSQELAIFQAKAKGFGNLSFPGNLQTLGIG